MAEPAENGRPGWRDVLAAVEGAEANVLYEVRENRRKIQALEKYNSEHPVPDVRSLEARADKMDRWTARAEGRLDIIARGLVVLVGVSIIVLGAGVAGILGL